MSPERIWVPLKCRPDRGIVLTPVGEDEGERVFRGRNNVLYRLVSKNGTHRWFSNSEHAARRLKEPKVSVEPVRRQREPEWHLVKSGPPLGVMLEVVRVEGSVTFYQSKRGALYRCEIQDGAKRWYSNAVWRTVKKPLS